MPDFIVRAEGRRGCLSWGRSEGTAKENRSAGWSEAGLNGWHGVGYLGRVKRAARVGVYWKFEIADPRGEVTWYWIFTS